MKPKLTIRQNQLLAFIQKTNTDWFQSFDLCNKFIEQGGHFKSDPWAVLDGLARNGMLESDFRSATNDESNDRNRELWWRITEAGKVQKIDSTKEPVRNTGPVTSYDPRKKIIVAEMKRRSACSKITNVKETKTHFEGDPMFLVRHRLGNRWVNKDKISIPKSDFKFKDAK